MSKFQKFGQVIALFILSVSPVVAAMGWALHVIEDSESVAGSLAVNSVLAVLGSFMIIGIVAVTVMLILFWVWVFGIAWDSEEAREARADFERDA